MPLYAFATVWHLNAPIDDVYALIQRPEEWPRWWPSVLEVRQTAPAGSDGLGAVYRATFRGRLPYDLAFDAEVTSSDPPRRLELRATGELDGTGTWTLTEAHGRTVVRYDWRVRTTRAWMNLLAPLPFVDEIFRLNHHAVMRDGLAGIRRELGVGGVYERLD